MEAIPATVRILIIFALILLAIKRKWMLGNVFLAGALAMGVMFVMTPADIGRSAFMAMTDPKTLCLALVVGLILVLSHSLERSGQMADLLNAFKGVIHRPKINLVIFPALIGLLPMPGGAIFSAPMVKNMGLEHRLSGGHLSYINYWFRHIWEYWWPLYPGILLTTAMAGVDLWRLVLFTFPLTPVAIMAGYWPLRGWRWEVSSSPDNAISKPLGPFLKHLTPIAFAIFGGLTLGMVLTDRLPYGLNSVAKETGLIIALIAAIFWVWHSGRFNWRRRWGIIRQPEMVKMLYMVTSILVFKSLLEGSGAVAQISREMLQWHIPLMPICMILPFLVGTVGGITIAYVGTTFPILISLIDSLNQSHLLVPYLMLALASGFSGVLVSPLHLCLLLSNEFFETSLMPVYRNMIVPLVVLLASAMAYFGLLYYFMF